MPVEFLILEADIVRSTNIMAINLNGEMNNEDRWLAVVNRDVKLDGAFVFGVTSTGIYCRPSCAARRPNQEHVRFFNSPEAAEAGGFRACKRCHPKDENANTKSELVRQACALIDESDEALTLAELSEALNVSSFHLQRTFKGVLGISPRQYADSRRVERFKENVRAGQAITGAMYDAGFSSSSRLYEHSSAQLGMTPATYGRNGRGATINYAVEKCELGLLLVAATEKGICAVRLGSDADELEKDLTDEFSAAQLVRDNSALSDAVQLIVKYLSGNGSDLNLPLDVQATAFQRQVWEALRAIPYGGTKSYSEVAQAIGRPTAVRAVARACATNPVALVVPCHRVIGSDKSLSGYRWGLERKKQLLEKEAEVVVKRT